MVNPTDAANIASAATGPQQVTIDGETVISQDPTKLIAVAQFNAAAARSSRGGLPGYRVRMRPGSTTGFCRRGGNYGGNHID